MKTILDIDELVFSPPDLGGVLHLPGPSGGGTKIYDRSPYGNTGTITGATWTRLPSGLWVLSFDGTDDWINCGTDDSLDITGNISIIAWIYPEDIPVNTTGQRVVLLKGKRVSGVVNVNYALDIAKDAAESSKGRCYFKVYAAGWGVSSSNEVVELNKWQLIGATFNPTTDVVKFYHNGASAGSNTETKTPIAISYHLSLGAHRDDGGFHPSNKPFDGCIALPRIYNYARSALQVQNDFSCEKHLFGVW